MRPIINTQISGLKESATLSINQHAIKLLNDGEDICHLGFGESPFPVPGPMQIALREIRIASNIFLVEDYQN